MHHISGVIFNVYEMLV